MLACGPAASYFRFYRDSVQSGGNYLTGSTYAWPSAMPDGTYAFAVTAVDALGNESAPSGEASSLIQ